MLEILIASKNKGKIEEITGYKACSRIKWLTFKDFDKLPEVEESGR